MAEDRAENANRFRRKRETILARDVSMTKLMIMGAVSGGAAVLTIYAIFAALGVFIFDWRFLLAAALFGVASGMTLGARSLNGGIAAGVLAGVWLFVEIVGAIIAAIGAIIAAVLSGGG